MARQEDERAVYVISIAAELAGMHPQTLRIYERKGLLRPARSAGNTRRYSERDINRLREIQELTQRGVNLAGVKMIMEMQAKLARARREMEAMSRELDRSREEEGQGPPRSDSAIIPLASTKLPWEARG